MGPPIFCPHSHPRLSECQIDSGNSPDSFRRCVDVKFLECCRVLLNFAVLAIAIQVLCMSVKAGPVILNLDYLQGPVPLARNIRHLPCISRRTGQEGLCMFAIDCLKANGSHLGTCIDRFYFGSCCQIPDKTILPQIINNIDDNTIDGASFVHPQTENKVTVTKIPEILNTKRPFSDATTVKTTVFQDKTEGIYAETKSDDLTTIDNKIPNDDKLTTAVVVETTTKKEVTTTKTPEITTEVPIKISTFQTVSGDSNNLATEKPIKSDDKKPSSTTTQQTTVTTTIKPKPQYKPTYKPRPTFRPTNFTKPAYISTTQKPKPTKPVALYNTTRKPPYRLPPKRPSTKKPLPSPPRLNITILPQSTSSRPIFTRPLTPTITYINTTVATVEDKLTSITTTTTTAKSSTQTTTSSSTTSTTTTTTIPPTTSTTVSPNLASTSTEFPPLVTWSNTVDSATKAPEKITTTAEEIWSPITPPEGWVLISTIPPKPETTSTTTTSTTTSTSSTTEQTTTAETTQTTQAEETSPETTVQTTETPMESTTEITSSSTMSSTISSTSTTTSLPSTEVTNEGTEAPVLEFTVNVTLTPTVPTSTSSFGLTTFTSVSNKTEGNTTEATTVVANATQSILSTETEHLSSSSSTTSSPSRNETSSPTETPIIPVTMEPVNMSDYKDVCGRRLWPQGRIVGGAKSGFGQWPWQISLRQYRTSTYLHKCGAALLNENWAITAAHCVEHVPPSELLVRLGEHDLANEDEPYGFAERRVQIVASHPHFDPATFEYDLALLRFYEPVTFQPNILPVCVPDDDEDFVGKTAYVTGWGRLYDEGPLPSVLQEVQVPVINNTACEAMYRAAGYNEHIPNIFICAGWKTGGSDSCEGDSGGPMVVQRSRDKRFVLGGIISWGIGCAEPNQPGVYTRISEFRDWINQILQF
ncbi:serine proteinase stubble [Hyposmocoma kahamanoa]|uniref:serine proteinase stubble n=1 Tax=Hyposmocoma kahamanoa TaxID=1477025 RepID=UPI000E6D7125|nr:serine proteinase stubble [Hyposmocoma kahamanoa]